MSNIYKAVGINKLLEQKLKTQLTILIAIMIVGFVAAGLYANSSYEKVQIKGGPIYDSIINAKDLGADILPPPAYLIESWQLALEMVAIKNGDLKGLVDKSNQLSKDFSERITYWDKTIPTKEMHQHLIEKLAPSGKKFINIRDNQLIPAVRSGDEFQITSALQRLKEAYLVHRRAVDELVEMTNKYAQDVELSVPAEVGATQSSVVTIFLVIIGITLFGLFVVVNEVIKKLGIEPSQLSVLARSFADGDLKQKINLKPNDKTSVAFSIQILQKTLGELVHGLQEVSREHDAGNTDSRVDSSAFKGGYAEMVDGINQMVGGHIDMNYKVVSVVKSFGDGNLDEPLEQFPGKKAYANHAIEDVRDNIKTLVSDTYRLSQSAIEGDLAARADASKHRGDFRKIVDGVNNTLDAVITPLNVAASYVNDIAKGNIPEKITEEYRGDFSDVKNNLNQCIDTINTLIAEMNAMSTAHDAGDIDVKVKESQFKGAYAEMAKGLNAMVTEHIEVTKQAMACVEGFGKGDFNAPMSQLPGKKAFVNETIEQVRQNLLLLRKDVNMLADAAKEGHIATRADTAQHYGDFRKVVEGFNNTLDMIVGPIATVKEAVATINNAVNEIATGNNDLSARTEEQATSLERTAANMKDLSSTVKRNAESAHEANRLAEVSSGVAVKGGEVVNGVVVIMQAINESARKIEEIISVIDGIAFQTNILALNAAVEAARAGEQGRGFAVVAGDVRNLAQRSASAAKEIKELITDSVNRTHEGTEKVEEAGTTMEEIVSSVQQFTNIMEEISAASSSQSEGLVQVDNAISSMEQTTQQNAALVEEAAAASESLLEQANALSDTVSTFKLGNIHKDKANSPLLSMEALAVPA